ncbi:MAG: hypothetical protein OEY22_01660 [Candidatus Bathyarchaeota archaeon]|nr:hypothetical protein [Candidatus Bathyarchaeota archaeon]
MTENKKFVVKVIGDGRITIPWKIREKQGIKEGDLVSVREVTKIQT